MRQTVSGKNTTFTVTGKHFRAGAVVEITKGKTSKKATIRSQTAMKIVCILPTKKAITGTWDIRITKTDHTSIIKKKGFTVKRRLSANETGTGQVSGMVLSTPGSLPVPVVPAQGNTLPGNLHGYGGIKKPVVPAY